MPFSVDLRKLQEWAKPEPKTILAVDIPDGVAMTWNVAVGESKLGKLIVTVFV
jgi:hypothetical protein